MGVLGHVLSSVTGIAAVIPIAYSLYDECHDNVLNKFAFFVLRACLKTLINVKLQLLVAGARSSRSLATRILCIFSGLDLGASTIATDLHSLLAHLSNWINLLLAALAPREIRLALREVCFARRNICLALIVCILA